MSLDARPNTFAARCGLHATDLVASCLQHYHFSSLCCIALCCVKSQQYQTDVHVMYAAEAWMM